MNEYLYLGMAIQAFMVALLWNTIKVTPRQQFLAGMFFLIMFVVMHR